MQRIELTPHLPLTEKWLHLGFLNTSACEGIYGSKCCIVVVTAIEVECYIFGSYIDYMII